MLKRTAHDIGRDAKRSKVDAQYGESSSYALGQINTISPVPAGAAGQEDDFFEKRKPFLYHPLGLDSDSIRVLEIMPGSEQAIIKCKMRNTNIEEEEYRCLSYMWEPKNPSHEIEVNEKTLTVGENLWQFLQSARFAGIREPLWIDALCINQSDYKEKNHQVSLMSRIYKQAQKTLIWLGVSAMGCTLNNVFSEVEKSVKAIHTWNIKEQVSKVIRDMNPDDRESVITDIIQFLSLPYWSRIWIVQEVVLSPRKVLFLGTGEVQLRLFSQVLPALAEDCAGSYQQPEGIMSLPGELFTWPEYATPNTVHPQHGQLLSWLVRGFAHSGCFDKRDHVYALLSLAQNGHKFTIDYDINAETLLQRTLSFCMDNIPLDELLLIGATLIRVLEIRPVRAPSTMPKTRDVSHSSIPISSIERSRDSCLVINLEHSMPVSSPVWGEAVLDIADDSGHLLRRDTTLCIYIVISDATDIHIFEYAVKEDDSGICIMYARAHEYMRGKPQIYKEPLDISHRESYIWVDLPSEKVYYYADPASTLEYRAIFPDLIKCTAPQLKLEEPSPLPFNDYSATAEPQPYRLKPAKRDLDDVIPLTGIVRRSQPSIFISARDILERDIIPQTYDYTGDGSGMKLRVCNYWTLKHWRPPKSGDAKLKLLPQTPRATTLRVEYTKRDDEEDNNNKEGDDEESLLSNDKDSDEREGDNKEPKDEDHRR